MALIGQDRLKAIFKTFTLTTLPKTLLFLGPEGAGKATFANYLAEEFSLNTQIIDEKVSAEELDAFMQKPIYTLYIIDLTKFNEKQQNQFLKFIEEPSQYMYVALLANSTLGILPTVLNRCQKYYLDAYTKEQLKSFDWVNPIEYDFLYEVCPTPGQIMTVDTKTAKPLYDLCELIIKVLPTNTYANTLKIATKINYAEEYNKYEFNLFFNMLSYVAAKVYKETGNETALKVYLITDSAIQELAVNKTIQKENYVYKFLTELWEGVR